VTCLPHDRTYPFVSANDTYEKRVESAWKWVAFALSRFKCHISYSGGKDSEIPLYMARILQPETPAVFSNTGVEDPRTIAHIKTKENITWTKGEKDFWWIVAVNGFPGSKDGEGHRHGNQCCMYLKEKPLDNFARGGGFTCSIDGLTADESRQRWMTMKRMGPIYRHQSREIIVCHPIWDWSAEDVLRFIKENGISLNPVYQFAGRCGCLPCTAYSSWIPTLAKQNPKMLSLILKMRGQAQLSFCGGPDPVVMECMDCGKSHLMLELVDGGPVCPKCIKGEVMA
jgi:3'-phosphoadenosine 5'-phosphosulfate sulfotransferase (PAPS reductase)/FAD synthetase